MNANFSFNTFYSEIEFSLPESTAAKRKTWATSIIEEKIDVKDLSNLLMGEPKVSSRFLWLLSEVGALAPEKLFDMLPYLLNLSDQLEPGYETSFATFWLIAGVPDENEARAIDLLFQWILSAEITVTIKLRAILVLFKLTQKYPELKNELKYCLEDQLDKHTHKFRKRVTNILLKLQP